MVDLNKIQKQALCIFSLSIDQLASFLSNHCTQARPTSVCNDILAVEIWNEDGFDDALVTARADDSAGTNRGAVHVFSGGEDFSLTHSIYGATNGQYIGWQIAAINDFDGDGIIEYAISSIYSDYDGTSENNTGSVLLLPKSMLFDEALDVSTLQEFHGLQSKEHVGYSITDAGDFNGDGQTDLLIGSPDYNINDADEGRAFLVYGGENRVRSVTCLPYLLWCT